MEIREVVLKTLKDSKNPLKCGEVADMCGHDKALVDKAIKILVREDLVMSPKKCYYQAK